MSGPYLSAAVCRKDPCLIHDSWVTSALAFLRSEQPSLQKHSLTAFLRFEKALIGIHTQKDCLGIEEQNEKQYTILDLHLNLSMLFS